MEVFSSSSGGEDFVIWIMILSIPLVAIVGGTLVAMLKVLKGGSSKNTGLGPEDAEAIQEMHEGLMRMEERVEALETILLDRERAKRGSRQ